MNRYININSGKHTANIFVSDDDTHGERERMFEEFLKFIEDHSDSNGCFEGLVVSREVNSMVRKVG